jgi:hypothetical protein
VVANKETSPSVEREYMSGSDTHVYLSIFDIPVKVRIFEFRLKYGELLCRRRRRRKPSEDPVTVTSLTVPCHFTSRRQFNGDVGGSSPPAPGSTWCLTLVSATTEAFAFRRFCDGDVHDGPVPPSRRSSNSTASAVLVHDGSPHCP